MSWSRFRSFCTIWGLLWCVLHLDQLGAGGVCSCFVWWWGLKGTARGRTALAGHWEGLVGRKLGLTKTNRKRRLQRKCREQLLTESLVRGPCWCHLGEDRQQGWALLWGVDHSHHSQWEWERPQGRTSHCPTRNLCWCAQVQTAQQSRKAGTASFPISLLCSSFRAACISLLMVNKRFVLFSLEVFFY